MGQPSHKGISRCSTIQFKDIGTKDIYQVRPPSLVWTLCWH